MRKRWFKFSDDDREELLETLDGYDLQKVKEFIKTIEGEINFLSPESFKSFKKRRTDNITRTLKHLENTIQELDDIMNTISFMPMKYVADFRIDGSAYLGRQVLVPKCIEEIKQPMRALIKILEDTLKEERKYRNSLLTNEKGEKFSPAVITWIADSYKKLIDPPHPHKGPFSKIIDIVLGDFQNRNRSIRRALKSIK